MPPSGTGSLIVVGVDGSPTSLAALRWAAGEADRHGGRLLAVRAVDGPGPPEHAERSVLAASVRAALGGDPAVPVAERVVAGPPDRALLAAAGDADLLVVGARGHSGLAGRILGSTAIAVARTAPVPVVVVPAVDVPDEDGQDARHAADPAGGTDGATFADTGPTTPGTLARAAG